MNRNSGQNDRGISTTNAQPRGAASNINWWTYEKPDVTLGFRGLSPCVFSFWWSVMHSAEYLGLRRIGCTGFGGDCGGCLLLLRPEAANRLSSRATSNSSNKGRSMADKDHSATGLVDEICHTLSMFGDNLLGSVLWICPWPQSDRNVNYGRIYSLCRVIILSFIISCRDCQADRCNPSDYPFRSHSRNPNCDCDLCNTRLDGCTYIGVDRIYRICRSLLQRASPDLEIAISLILYSRVGVSRSHLFTTEPYTIVTMPDLPLAMQSKRIPIPLIKNVAFLVKEHYKIRSAGESVPYSFVYGSASDSVDSGEDTDATETASVSSIESSKIVKHLCLYRVKNCALLDLKAPPMEQLVSYRHYMNKALKCASMTISPTVVFEDNEIVAVGASKYSTPNYFEDEWAWRHGFKEV